MTIEQKIAKLRETLNLLNSTLQIAEIANAVGNTSVFNDQVSSLRSLGVDIDTILNS